MGKSTLLNVFLGRKVSIATEKPQTTRNRIQGIKTYTDAQIIFIDTPGIHEPAHMLGESMVRTARNSMKEIDVVLFVIDPGASIKKDKVILESIKKTGIPVILVINKLDRIKKPEL
ncbi:MAG: GTPase Era, partial [Nitrospirota bacterium]|nr:GTPase Era [Nitrospirota bacterium]